MSDKGAWPIYFVRNWFNIPSYLVLLSIILGHGDEIEVLFIDDNIRFKTSHSNVKFLGKLNIGDVKKVKWEDGNYYDARILNLSK